MSNPPTVEETDDDKDSDSGSGLFQKASDRLELPDKFLETAKDVLFTTESGPVGRDTIQEKLGVSESTALALEGIAQMSIAIFAIIGVAKSIESIDDAPAIVKVAVGIFQTLLKKFKGETGGS